MSLLGLILAPLVLLAAWRAWWRRGRGRFVLPPDVTPVVAMVRAPMALGPLDRHERVEAPLDAALQDAGLGEVDDAASIDGPGGGVAAVTVTLRLVEPDRAIPLVLDVLRRLGAPASTTVTWTSPTGLREERVGALA